METNIAIQILSVQSLFHSCVSSESEYRHNSDGPLTSIRSRNVQLSMESFSALHVRFTCSNMYPYISVKSCVELSTLTEVKSNSFLEI